MSRSWVALAALTGMAACDVDGPADLSVEAAVLLVAGGDEQFAPPGSSLPLPLRVSARRASDDAPASGVTVIWSVSEGSGARLGTYMSVTAGNGIALNTLVLGPSTGAYVVRASVDRGAGLDFRAWAVDPPRLESVEPRAVRAGSRVRMRGRSFRPDPSQNLALFDGFRGRVMAASDSVLEVQVPACLPSRRVSVSVTVGSAASESLSLVVEGAAAPPVILGVGEDRTVEVMDGTECVQLAGGARYLLVTQSAGTVGGGLYGFSLRGVSSTTSSAHTAAARSTSTSTAPPVSFPAVFHQRLRDLEEEAWASARTSAAGPARSSASAPPPRVGDVAGFRVVDGAGRVHEVHAVARVVGARVAFFVDVEATGEAALSDADLRGLAADLDDTVFPVVSATFGTPSDVDGNERVIVLLTPAVNRLTPQGSLGYVGGFFFGVDLLPTAPNSNGAELLYAMVPDPRGRFGDPRSRELVLASLPSILAHELQHLVHYNERMFVLRATKNEALWLSEALAQSAETLVGDTLRRRGSGAKALGYLEPTYQRARAYLEDPGPVSLLVSAGLGTLEERGAGWLFLRYLQGHHPGGGTDLLRALTRSTRTGLENLEAVTQRSWSDSFSDWSVATFTDGAARPPGGRLHYADFDVRALVPEGAPYPLSPVPLGEEFEETGTRLAASSAYFELANAIPVALRLADRLGGAPAQGARFILRVVRLQ